jgi:hypothetical protein
MKHEPNHDASDRSGDAAPEVAPRRPYKPPVLSSLGSVLELTMGAGSGPLDFDRASRQRA